MIKFITRSLISLLAGFTLAFAFNVVFLAVLSRPRLEQYLLLLFSTAALGYLIYLFLESRDGNTGSFRIRLPRWGLTEVISFVRAEFAGLLLAFLFFAIYLSIGLKLNFPTMDTVDNFFDADNSSWMARIADPQGYHRTMRGPHPFAYLFFRPLGWILNLITQNHGFSPILLNTLVGGLCVFLTWLFIKKHTENRIYALLIAALLGLSTSHMVFGSVVETYIFSAASLIGFFVLLSDRKDSIWPLIPISLVTFGITITNFVQTMLGVVVSRPRWRDIIKYAGLIISLGILLSMIHYILYPSSRLFFLPTNAEAEEQFVISIFKEPFWKALGRIQLLVRTIFLYTVVAPTPYVFVGEVGGTFPRFNFFKIVPGTFSFSSYEGLGTVLVFAWAALLLLSGILFVLKLVRTRKIGIEVTFVVCLLFNFLLHINYGYEPFLYSPDWGYALIFFIALTLAPISENLFLQGGMLIFLVLLAFNQFQFFQFIIHAIAPFVVHQG